MQDNYKETRATEQQFNTNEQQNNTAEELIGKEVMIDDHRFVIESVGSFSGDVSMRDITMQGQRIPINRVEKIGYVRRLLEEQSKENAEKFATETETVYPAEKNGLPYDIVVEKLKVPEPEQTSDKKYAYHLGDSVYIGASQYEILSFDDNRVMLYDFEYGYF